MHLADLPAVESLWGARVRWAVERGIGTIRPSGQLMLRRIVAMSGIVGGAPSSVRPVRDEAHCAVDVLREITDPAPTGIWLSWILTSSGDGSRSASGLWAVGR
ncbi:hypothetical protein [Streptomyces sp. NPDC001933]|uniref:hypothetical protein n=1 Tax=Streptomyces sp. NPDC001933 TaxID=3364626 RepID=UPI00368A9A04